MPDNFGMALNDGSAASRQFVASSSPMSSQMTAFATGKGRYGVQAAFFALILVMVASFVTRQRQGHVIVVAGLVALSIFGLAGTAYVWWRSRRKVLIGVTSDGLTVNQRRDVFPFADAKLGPWVNMGVTMSVNRNVTTPEGAAAADTHTGFHKEPTRTSNIAGIGSVVHPTAETVHPAATSQGIRM